LAFPMCYQSPLPVGKSSSVLTDIPITFRITVRPHEVLLRFSEMSCAFNWLPFRALGLAPSIYRTPFLPLLRSCRAYLVCEVESHFLFAAKYARPP